MVPCKNLLDPLDASLSQADGILRIRVVQVFCPDPVAMLDLKSQKAMG